MINEASQFGQEPAPDHGERRQGHEPGVSAEEEEDKLPKCRTRERPGTKSARSTTLTAEVDDDRPQMMIHRQTMP
jgi:hypothetical protein